MTCTLKGIVTAAPFINSKSFWRVQNANRTIFRALEHRFWQCSFSAGSHAHWRPSGRARKAVQLVRILHEHEVPNGFVGKPQRNEIDKVPIIWHWHRTDRMWPITAPDYAIGPGFDDAADHRHHVTVRIRLSG